jgi:lysyl-tRNA synthetase class 2
MLELYQAYADFNDMMELTEKLYRKVILETKGTTEIEYQGNTISFEVPWRRIKMADALREYAGINIEEMDDRDMVEEARKRDIDIEGEFSRGLVINELFEISVEDKLIQPTFVTHFPRETTPLCKVDQLDARYIQRFEPYINGWEMGNAYSELNDPVLQKELLENQSASRHLEIDDEKPPMDEDFVRALDYGMPPTGGLGLSIDRMVMLLTDQFSIRDVILFPQMRPEQLT